jgi:NADH-quinone oxidoreductase subunit L
VLLVGGRRTDRWGPLLGLAMPVAAFVYGLIAFFTLFGDSNRSQDVHLYSWIPVADFQVNLGLLIDQLSICFVLGLDDVRPGPGRGEPLESGIRRRGQE